MDHLSFAVEDGSTMTMDRPPRRWRQVNPDPDYGFRRYRFDPDADVIDLLNNILRDVYVEPVDLMSRDTIDHQTEERPPVEFIPREGKIVGHYLWGAKLSMVGMLWKAQSVESLNFLRDYIAPPFEPWSTTRIGHELRMHRANVNRDLRNVCEKLGCPRAELRDRADRGLERTQKKLLKARGLWYETNDAINS